MTDREKVIKGLECCMSEKICNSPCPYKGQCDDGGYYYSKAIEDALALLEEQEPIEARLHLCESYAKEYPECDATVDGIVFGCGVGNDNIIGCTAYVNRWKAAKPRVMTINELFSRLGADRINREPFAIEIKDGFCAWMVGDSAMDLPETDLRDVLYGKTWRCWTAKPTEEQQEAVAWRD